MQSIVLTLSSAYSMCICLIINVRKKIILEEIMLFKKWWKQEPFVSEEYNKIIESFRLVKTFMIKSKHI